MIRSSYLFSFIFIFSFLSLIVIYLFIYFVSICLYIKKVGKKKQSKSNNHIQSKVGASDKDPTPHPCCVMSIRVCWMKLESSSIIDHYKRGNSFSNLKGTYSLVVKGNGTHVVLCQYAYVGWSWRVRVS